MPGDIDPIKLSTINLIVYQLSLLLNDLLNAARGTADPTKLIQINNEYAAVQTCMFQASQAQMASDDVSFSQATSVLNSQADMLVGMERQITAIVSDVALAGRIVGYIAQIASLVAKI